MDCGQRWRKSLRCDPTGLELKMNSAGGLLERAFNVGFLNMMMRMAVVFRRPLEWNEHSDHTLIGKWIEKALRGKRLEEEMYATAGNVYIVHQIGCPRDLSALVFISSSP